MSALSLLHHTYDGRRETSATDYAAGWSVETVPGAPPISGAMEAALRQQVVPQVVASHRYPTRWWHCCGNAWSAVLDLHRAGRHDDALAVARLLFWCDSRHAGRETGCWEIASDETREK